MSKDKKLKNCTIQFPEDGLVRAYQIIGDPSKGIAPFFPVSRSQWFDGIRKGIYPKGTKLSSRVTVWKAQEIRDLVSNLTSQEVA